MTSKLNPEAPEFKPILKSTTEDGYTHAQVTVRNSNKLPRGNSHNSFKTFKEFNCIAFKLSQNVVFQSNQILTTELKQVKFTTDIQHNTEKIADANDSMLDRVNMNIDTICGLNKNYQFPVYNNVSVQAKETVITKIQMGSTTLIGAKNIPRPQLLFKDKIDNSKGLWVPKISEKPNSLKPLALKLQHNASGVAVGYEHPYLAELNQYNPPFEFTLKCDPIMPQPLEQTTYTYVCTGEQVDNLIKHLEDVKEIAVDLEHHAYRTYQGITCLIQISTDEGGDFVIDALAVREHLHKLNLAFTNPNKIKVFHGADMDVLWLQRDFGVYIVGLFDTHQAAKFLNFTGLSLKYLLMKYCNMDIDKKYQLADWRMRPLPGELVHYARMDTHYLLYIWRKMRNELLEAGAGDTHVLLSVFDKSRRVSGMTYSKSAVDDRTHMDLYVKSKKSFNSQQLAALQMLFQWRDNQARELDESITYLLPNHMVLALAENLPREIQGINACCSPMPPFVKQNLITINRMMLTCRELPVEPQLYHMPAGISQMANMAQPTMPNDVHDMTQMPDFRDDVPINLDKSVEWLAFENNVEPAIEIFMTPPPEETPQVINSTLNADAKLFIPPFDRYRKYRELAQIEEMKEFREKEAKIAALGKGNELIKSQVLEKLQQAKELKEIQHDDTVDLTVPQVSAQRKRKILQKTNTKDVAGPAAGTSGVPPKDVKFVPQKKNVNPYVYVSADYAKFYNKSHKSKPATKFKKHKN